MVDEKAGFQRKNAVVTLWSQKLREKEILEIIPQYMVAENHEKLPHRPQAMGFKTSGNKRFIPPHQLEEEINQIGDTKKGNNISSAA